MNNKNIILTGIPRSGTTLTCYLLNKLPNTVALHEPIEPNESRNLKAHNELYRYIEQFFVKMRISIYHHNVAISKQVNGQFIDNGISDNFNELGIREGIESKRNPIYLGKELTSSFLLGIKRPAVFTALLETLNQHFPCYAVIRNPLSILASWNTVRFAKEGRSAAEQMVPTLAHHLSHIKDRIARQLYLLSWFFEQYHRFLSTQSVLYYENIIASHGKALSVITPKAYLLNEALESKNLNPIYDRQQMLMLGERLLKTEGVFWEFYSKASVETLLETCASNQQPEVFLAPEKKSETS
jgi:hypothetical protein